MFLPLWQPFARSELDDRLLRTCRPDCSHVLSPRGPPLAGRRDQLPAGMHLRVVAVSAYRWCSQKLASRRGAADGRGRHWRASIDDLIGPSLLDMCWRGEGLRFASELVPSDFGEPPTICKFFFVSPAFGGVL